MRLPNPLATVLSLLLTTTTLTHALTLAQFQPIVSFPSACTAAYDTSIQNCNAKDFAGGNPCSKSCIASLQSISDKINTACVGTRADPTTLIGLFFQGRGVSTLCPNVVTVSAGSGEDSIGSSTMVASSKSVGSSLLAASSSPGTASATSTSASKKSSKTSSAEATSASTKSRTSTASTPERTPTSTVTSAAQSSTTTTSISLRGGFTSTAVNNGVATVLTSKSQQTANPDGFGGGGSPFEVGVNGGAILGARGLETLLVAFVVGMALVLR